MFSVVEKTCNQVVGCKHGCLYCWARMQAKRQKNRHEECYLFVPHLHKERLKANLGRGKTIWPCDMGDLFGKWVPRNWITAVLLHVKNYPENEYLFLTKNPQRYSEFIGNFEDNMILGSTIECTHLPFYSVISKAPPPESRAECMVDLNHRRKFISIEPILEFDLETMVAWIKEIEPEMVFVGYDNYRKWYKKLYQATFGKPGLPEPSIRKTELLVKRLQPITKVHCKTVRKAWWENENQRDSNAEYQW